MVRLFVLPQSSLSGPRFHVHVATRNVECFSGGIGHQVQPDRVFGRIPIMRSFVLGDVQMIFVAVDHQRNLGNIPFVQAVTRDAASRGEPSQMLGSVGQSLGQQFGLVSRFVAGATKGRFANGIGQAFDRLWFRRPVLGLDIESRCKRFGRCRVCGVGRQGLPTIRSKSSTAVST